MLTHTGGLSDASLASPLAIGRHNLRKPPLALVKDGADTLMLRTLLRQKGFAMLAVDWQHAVRENRDHRPSASCHGVPLSRDHVMPKQGPQSCAEQPKMVRLGLIPRTGDRTAVGFLERLLEHPSIRVLLVRGARYPEEMPI